MCDEIALLEIWKSDVGSGNQLCEFVIIDEWDVLIHDESANEKIQKEYIDFLRGLFKGTEPAKFLHLAFLTGILPIKRGKTQSALNNFNEYTMLASANLAPYIGFTEEVRKLCKWYGMDFRKVKNWYDGYILGKEHIYNPNAVVNVMLRGEIPMLLVPDR